MFVIKMSDTVVNEVSDDFITAPSNPHGTFTVEIKYPKDQLLEAVARGDMTTAIELIENGVPASHQCMIIAIKRGHLNLVMWLESYGYHDKDGVKEWVRQARKSGDLAKVSDEIRDYLRGKDYPVRKPGKH